MKAIGVDSGKGATNAVRPLDPSERRTFNTANTPQRTRGNPNVTIIAESGLYKLVMRSDKSNAKPFQDWVTKVVLPAIRKDGGYIMGEDIGSIGLRVWEVVRPASSP
jgi:prophage antirepressor-like protein